MDNVSVGLLRMIETTGGMHAGSDPARKQRLEELRDEGYVTLEKAGWAMPDLPAPEPTYRLTEKGRQLLAA